ncbi:MAG: tetratricopeptide repeat protein [Bryobacteraceae bacterium]
MLYCSKGRRLATRAALVVFSASICAVWAQSQEDQLAEQSHHAKELMAEGRFAEAIPIYRELVLATSGNPGFVLNLGLAEEMAGHPAEAAEQFESVLKTQPDNVPALTSLGTARLQLNQPKLAIGPLEKLIALQPENRNARGMLAGALMATGRDNEAAEEYRKLAAGDGSDAQAWYGLGKAYEALADRSFEQLEKIAPESAYALTLVADSQASRVQYRSAFFFYKQAEGKKPDLLTLHAGLAHVYAKSGHDDWAREEQKQEQKLAAASCAHRSTACNFLAGKYLEAARGAGATPDGLFWAAKAYNALALGAFEQLGKLPDSVQIHALKANILRGHRQYLEAVNEWRAALKLAPGDPRLEHELAAALFLANDYKTLIPMLQSELAKGDRSADTNFMLGESFLRSEQPDKAIPYLEAALKAQPSMKPADASLGLALALVNKPVEAIPHLEKALDLDDDGSLHYQLARAYQAKGDTQRARQLMTQYQQIQGANQQHKEEVAREAQITAPSTQ